MDPLSGKPFGATLPDANAYLTHVFPGLGVGEKEATSVTSESRRALPPGEAADLLLGTQGWRRFVYTDLAGALAPIAPSQARLRSNRPLIRRPVTAVGNAAGSRGIPDGATGSGDVEALRLGMPAPAGPLRKAPVATTTPRGVDGSSNGDAQG